MSVAALRQKMHSYLEMADDKKILALYAIMEDDIENSGIMYTDELKQKLDTRYLGYKNGNVKLISAKESKKRIRNILRT